MGAPSWSTFIAESYSKLPSTQIRWQSLVIETPWVTSPSSRTFPRMLPPRMLWERWGQGDKRLESCTWTRNWQRLTRRPRGGGPQQFLTLMRNAGVLQWFSNGRTDAHRLPPG